MARGLILVELGEALIKLGEFERARQVLADASASGDRKIELRARMVALGLELLTNPTGVSERILSDVEGLLPELEELGDDRVLAYAYRLLLTGDLMAARFDAASELAQRAGLHARRAGDRATELDALFWSFAGVTFGSTSVEEGIKRADDLLAEYGDSPRAEAAILPAVASLSAAAGRFDEARRAASRMKAIYEDLGMMLSLHATAMVRAPIEVLAGDLATAEAELRAGSDGLAKLGERSYFSTIAVMLADVVYRQGRHDEAEEIARTGAEAAAADDVSTQALWRSVQARVCARRGEHDEALRLMRESIALWEATDGIEFRGDALVAFAEVLQLGGRAPEAQEPLQRAIELYEQKGNVVSARATRAALERLQADVVAP
jgi:ATP/maltotriose-dependent transcriptional regulator MalT